MTPTSPPEPEQILFGLDRETDERSLAGFLRLFCDERFSSVLIPRMTDEEIEAIVGLLTRVMRNHLSEKEYHALFLKSAS
ncbi:MAG: hypothetical protein Kow0089_01920 [Desulfobulbaceae bacterium]